MIHRAAQVDAAAKVGHGTKVWQFASIVREAMIGTDCTVASCAIVDGAMVGNRCSIGHGASVHPGTWIGDDVFIGPAAVVCNDRWPRVGKDGFDVRPLIQGEFVTVEIEDGASIGAGAIILPGVVIGAGAMVAAGAVVSRNVPECHLFKRDGSMVPIDPARPCKRMRQS